MKRSHVFKSILGSTALLFVLAGCASAPAPQKPGEEVLKDGIIKMADVKSYSYDIAFKGDLSDTAGEKINFDVKLNGQLDGIDPTDPRLVMKLDGTVSDSTGTGGSAQGEVRLNKQNVYFNVMKLDVQGGEALPSDVTDLFGKWWSMEVPAGTFDELNVTLSPEDEAQQAKMKEVLQQSHIFGTPEYVGTENVMGESSYHYKVSVDNDGLLAFIKAAAEAEGETVSDADLEQGKQDLANVAISGDIWVGTQSGVINQFKGTMTLKGEPSGTVDINVTLGDVNKPVTIEAPAGAEKFPLESILGPMMGGLPTDSSMMDTTSIDDSSMMNGDAMNTQNMDALMNSGVMEGDISDEELSKMMQNMDLSQ